MNKLIRKIVLIPFLFNLILIPVIKAEETEKAAGNSFAHALSSIPWRKISKTGGAVIGGLFSATCVAYTYRNQIRKWTNTIAIWAAPYLGIKNLLGIRRLEAGQTEIRNVLGGHSLQLGVLQQGQWKHAEGQKDIQKTLSNHDVQFDRIRGEFDLLQTGVNDISSKMATREDVSTLANQFNDFHNDASKFYSTTDSRLKNIEEATQGVKNNIERLRRTRSYVSGVKFPRKQRRTVTVVEQEQTGPKTKLPTREAILNETFGNGDIRKISVR